MRQLYRMLTNLRAATTRNIDMTPLLAHLAHHRHPAGTMLFRKGDPSDCAYYIASGEVEIPEQYVRLGAGQFFGEVGVFASSGARTGSPSASRP
ncbi:MAG TPA: cyclic nucleotide-binding domain-containing protein [Acetobacteraceae bacterium]